MIDYTGKFKWSDSRMIIKKNSNTMLSNTFDADSKVQGIPLSEEIVIVSLSSIMQLGMCKIGVTTFLLGSGSVNIVVSDLGFNNN